MRGGLRAGWTLVSQVASSTTSAALAILLARSVDAEAFGAFGIAFAVFALVVGMTRAVVTTPLLVHHSAASAEAQAGPVRSCAGASLAVGLGAGALCLIAASIASDDLRVALALVGLALPGVLVQDAWRQALFTAARPRDAAVNDVVWAVVQLALAAVVLATGTAGTATLMAGWGAGALAGALLGVRQLGGWPLLRGALPWARRASHTGLRLGGEYALVMGAHTLVTLALGAVAGLAATGAVRAAQTLLGPLQVVVSATASFVVPALARRRATCGAAGLTERAVTTSLATGGLAVAFVGALLLLPDPWGEALLGDSWSGAASVLLPLGVLAVAVGASQGAVLSLKALARADLLLRAATVFAPLVLLGGVSGALVAGAVGVAWATAGAQVLHTALVWVVAARAMRRSAARHRGAPRGRVGIAPRSPVAPVPEPAGRHAR